MKKLIFILSILSLLPGSQYAFSQEKNSRTVPEDGENEEESMMCGGVERWSVKVLVDPAANTVNYTPINSTVSYLVTLSTPAPSSTMPRYPGVEDKTYKITCNITIKKVETDNDYHLVLSDGTNTLIGEIPDPNCAAASSSAHVNEFIAARNFVNANIASGNVFNVNIPPVTVTGVAFVDPPHNQTGAAPNNLELHPILDIHYATMTGTAFPDEIVKVNIFPNPVTDKLNMEIESKVDKLDNCEFRIFDALGNWVKTISLPKGGSQLNYSFNTDGMAAGFYFYRITQAGMPLYEGKIIKN